MCFDNKYFITLLIFTSGCTYISRYYIEKHLNDYYLIHINNKVRLTSMKNGMGMFLKLINIAINNFCKNYNDTLQLQLNIGSVSYLLLEADKH